MIGQPTNVLRGNPMAVYHMQTDPIFRNRVSAVQRLSCLWKSA